MGAAMASAAAADLSAADNADHGRRGGGEVPSPGQGLAAAAVMGVATVAATTAATAVPATAAPALAADAAVAAAAAAACAMAAGATSAAGAVDESGECFGAAGISAAAG